MIHPAGLEQLEGPAVASGCWSSAYWSWQYQQWVQEDLLAVSCKIILLFGNIFTKTYAGQPQRVLAVKLMASCTLMGQLATLCLMRSRQRDFYLRHRTLLLLVHWTCISTTVYWSLPLLVPPSMLPQEASLVHRLLSFAFRLGALLPATLTAMHRLPWQLIAACTSAYCCVIMFTWTRPFCGAVLAAETSAGRSMQTSLVTSIAAGLDYLTGQGQFAAAVDAPGLGAAAPATPASPWQPLAHMAVAVCSSNSSSSGSPAGFHSLLPQQQQQLELACDQLRQGQCLAVANTLCIWLGVFVSVTTVLLFERLNKWTFLHEHAGIWLQQPLVAGVPQHLQQPSKQTFLWMQLLQLQVLLDMPLLLLWFGFSSWSRPTAAVNTVLQLMQEQQQLP